VALAAADVTIVSGGGTSRFAAAVARGLVLAPYSRGYPLPTKVLMGRRSALDGDPALASPLGPAQQTNGGGGPGGGKRRGTTDGDPYAVNPNPLHGWPAVLQVSSPHLLRRAGGALPAAGASGGGGNRGALGGADKAAEKALAAKRSRLATEGSEWLKEAVQLHSGSLRVDVLAGGGVGAHALAAQGFTSAALGVGGVGGGGGGLAMRGVRSSGSGAVGSGGLRDQCLRAAAAESATGKACTDKYWWKC